jgi:hypothetical protein
MIAALAVSLLAVAACDTGDAEQPKPASSATAATTAVSDGDLTVPADFEEEAETSITAANYKAEADALEKEIAD